jgi:hypothetical protein
VPALEDAGYILRLPEIERYLLLRDRLREDADPESSEKASHKKYACLQLFCKLWKGAAKFLAAFARRRSGVRIPSAPLYKCPQYS